MISGAVIGSGATKRLSAVRWGVAGNIVFAWVLTIPAAADRLGGASTTSRAVELRMRILGMQIGAGSGSARMYELLALSGQNTVDIAKAVEQRFREHPSSSVTQEDVKNLEHEGDRLSSELFRCIESQFQTPYDRDDIVELVFAVDEVADKIENASELLGLYGIEHPTRQSLELCGCSCARPRSSRRCSARLKGLRGSAEEVRRIKQIEDEADQVARNARAGLFKDDRIDPVLVIRWKDIYEGLEDAVDACDTAAQPRRQHPREERLKTEPRPACGGRAPWRPPRGSASRLRRTPSVPGSTVERSRRGCGLRAGEPAATIAVRRRRERSRGRQNPLQLSNPPGLRAREKGWVAWRRRRRSCPRRPTLLNRELSWLDFNERVLALAADESMPLLERVKFCSIFAANLDEFFMVRVAGLMDQAASGLPVRSHDGLTPRETLAAIRERVEGLIERALAPLEEGARPGARRRGDHDRAASTTAASDELAELDRVYQREIFPMLTPLGVGPGQPFPYISGLSLSLGVLARDPDTGEERFARVKVPEQLPRFVSVGGGRLLLPLEDVLGHYLDSLFPGMEIVERAVFRVTRDADMELSDDADDLLEAVQAEIRRRRFGDVVRRRGRLVDVGRDGRRSSAPGLRVGDAEIYAIHGMLDLSEAMQIAVLDRPELKDEPWRPITQARLQTAHGSDELFAEIRRARRLRAPPVRVVRATRRALHRRGRPPTRPCAR